MNHLSFELTHDPGQLFAWAHLEASPNAYEVYSGRAFDHQRFPVLRMDRAGNREIVWMRQGLIPAYAHDEAGAENRDDAHVESLTCSSCFSSAFRRRRCIIPADKMIKLQHGPENASVVSSLLLRSGGIFGLGGVWETWENDSGHSVQTFAVVTAPTLPPLQQYAERLPVVIPETQQDRWLRACDTQHPPLGLVRCLDADELRDWEVSASSPTPQAVGPEAVANS